MSNAQIPQQNGPSGLEQPPDERQGGLLVPRKAPEKSEPSPAMESGASRVASVLQFGAAGFGLVAATLFALPELSRSFEAPPVAVLNQPSYTTVTPTFNEPEPSQNLDEIITEQTSSFDGAAILMVDSEPSGVSVEVDGSDQGGTPVSLTLDCLPGKPIKVEVTKRGYAPAKHTTFCRTNTMIKLFARMRKAEKKPGTPGKK
ncbi:PEGA domain-containing protein [Hyalangium rubrum]|uniref:PEGA domain-containing protein n=1 Tax=Hyalangium rubrum TaxID=3103134 RepID=A0ABU5GXH6_9BACT|nr:PEGA domain-containing protein [Hyalangium sp. s54d21]MDY7225885.1 PEGA domain-containing protein [Hyalangium sp. s54d21]